MNAFPVRAPYADIGATPSEILGITLRRCSVCHQDKPTSEFYSAGVGRGLKRACKRCDKYRVLASRRRYSVCGCECSTVELVYDYTEGGIDHFTKRACGRYCCRESSHVNVDVNHFCVDHRERNVIIVNGARELMRHRTNFERVNRDGSRYPASGPIEVHYTRTGQHRRVR